MKLAAPGGRAADMLTARFSAGNLPAAMLIISHDAIDAANQVAASIVCDKFAFPSCGECPQCKKSARDIHPDIIRISPAPSAIPVDVVRAVREKAYIGSPSDAAARAFIFDRASSMTVQAQNALLKILEEPPRGVYFILADKDGRNIIETLMSRLSVFRFFDARPVTERRYDDLCTLLLESILQDRELDFEQCLSGAFTTRAAGQAILEELSSLLRDAAVAAFGVETAQLSGRVGGLNAKTAVRLYDAAQTALLSLENASNINLTAAAFAVDCWEAVN